MIVTQQQPQVLWNLYHVYKKSNNHGKAFQTIKACLMHNNKPVNIVTAITALKDVQCLVNIDWTHPVQFEYCLRYLSEVTGYSPTELSSKVNL